MKTILNKVSYESNLGGPLDRASFFRACPSTFQQSSFLWIWIPQTEYEYPNFCTKQFKPIEKFGIIYLQTYHQVWFVSF